MLIMRFMMIMRMMIMIIMVLINHSGYWTVYKERIENQIVKQSVPHLIQSIKCLT